MHGWCKICTYYTQVNALFAFFISTHMYVHLNIFFAIIVIGNILTMSFSMILRSSKFCANAFSVLFIQKAIWMTFEPLVYQCVTLS